VPGQRLPQWDDAAETDAVVAFVVEWVPGAVCTPTTTGFSLCLAGSDLAGYRLQVFGLPAGTVEGRTLFTATPTPILGGGGFLGLAVDPLLLTILFRAPVAGDVFSFTAGGPFDYPQTPFLLAPGNLGFLAGLTWDAAALVVDGVGVFSATPPIRVVW
jgi:hypothetical protein